MASTSKAFSKPQGQISWKRLASYKIDLLSILMITTNLSNGRSGFESNESALAPTSFLLIPSWSWIKTWQSWLHECCTKDFGCKSLSCYIDCAGFECEDSGGRKARHIQWLQAWRPSEIHLWCTTVGFMLDIIGASCKRHIRRTLRSPEYAQRFKIRPCQSFSHSSETCKPSSDISLILHFALLFVWCPQYEGLSSTWTKQMEIWTGGQDIHTERVEVAGKRQWYPVPHRARMESSINLSWSRNGWKAREPCEPFTSFLPNWEVALRLVHLWVGFRLQVHKFPHAIWELQPCFTPCIHAPMPSSRLKQFPMHPCIDLKFKRQALLDFSAFIFSAGVWTSFPLLPCKLQIGSWCDDKYAL